MTYCVLVRIDSEGDSPVLLSDDSAPLVGEEGVRFRFVAETDDEMEAVRIADLVWHRCRGLQPGRPRTHDRGDPIEACRAREEDAFSACAPR